MRGIHAITLATFAAINAASAAGVNDKIPAGFQEISVSSCASGMFGINESYAIAGVSCPWFGSERRSLEQQVTETYPDWEIVETRRTNNPYRPYMLLIKKK